jgi:methylated-DNA-protein-cysteine methyltransferase related protein
VIAPPGGAQEPPPTPLTPFQSAVVDLVGSLTPGEVMTYAEVADEIGRPGSGQAVANVLRRVPGLPWWRVIPATGFLYRTHAPTQAPLLRADGVSVDDDGRVAPTTTGRDEARGGA